MLTQVTPLGRSLSRMEAPTPAALLQHRGGKAREVGAPRASERHWVGEGCVGKGREH